MRFWFFFDEFVNLKAYQQVVWLIGSNTDPDHDVTIWKPAEGHLYGVMCVDATIKTKVCDAFNRPWPNPVVMDLPTIHKVDRRWREYKLGKPLPSPSLVYREFERPGGAAIVQ